MRFLLLLTLVLTGCGPMTFVVGTAPGDRKLRATVVEDDGRAGSDRVAIIDVAGMIYNANKPGLLSEGENPVALLHEKLETARRDKRVKAVILRLNTPGGTVTASDAMYREVRRFRQTTGKPVVALMMDVAASGGYYLACSADEIVAYPTTVTGSIGVILQTISVKDGLNRIGIRAEAITSGPNKDVGSPFASMSDEHRAVLRRLVDDFYGQFSEVVRENRPGIPADQFAAVTDGRVLSGADAFKAGLVDHVGDIHDAFALAKSKAGLKTADLITYHRPLEYVGSPYAAGPQPPAGATQVNIAQFNFNDGWLDSTVGFYYLWQP